MTVEVIGWSGQPEPGGGRDAIALVDGIRVRVRRSLHGVRWLCDEHGAKSSAHCHHLAALANEPATPEKRNRNQ